MSRFVSLAPVKLHEINEIQVNDKLLCSVCHEDFKLSELVTKLVCDHVFHPSCIRPWLQRKNTCPVCRRLQVEEDDYDVEDDWEDSEEEDVDVENIDADIGQAVTVINNGTDNSLSVSVHYQHSPQHATSIQTISDSDDDTQVVFDFDVTDTPSSPSINSDIDVFDTTFDPYSDVEFSDATSDMLCLAIQNRFDTDSTSSRSNLTVDFEDTFDSNDLTCFDVTLESSMDIDQDYF